MQDAIYETTPLLEILTTFLSLEPKDWQEAQDHLDAQQAFMQIASLEMLLDQEASIVPEIEL